MPSTCSQLLPPYQDWKQNLALMGEARLRYQESGAQTDKAAFDEALEHAKEAQREYHQQAYEVLIDYESKELCQVEALIIQYIDRLLVGSREVRARIGITQGQITRFDVSSSRSTSLDEVLSFVSYFRELQWLYCNNTQISKRPDKLPDLLIYINIQNTPAARDSAMCRQLSLFKEVYPIARVVY